MRFTVRALFLVILCGAIGGSPKAFAQSGATGAISGTVLDVNGGAVADADVQIFSTATEAVVRHLNTTAEGSFQVTLLPPGNYRVVVNKSGFAEARASSIEVRVTETTRLSISLKPGTVSR